MGNGTGMAAPDFDLLVIGEVNPDLILTGNVTPAFGQVERMVEDATLAIGSSACIFACGAARLGLRVAFIGVVGDDEFGRFMCAQLAECGIDVSGIQIDPRLKTGLSVILSRGSDRAILTYDGSISALRYADIDLSLLNRARHLHMGSYYMLERLRPDVPRLFSQAKRSGVSVSIDTNYDPTEQWQGGIQETLAHADIFLPNETELLAIARETEVETALAKLAVEGRIVAAKLGAQGGVVRQNGRQYRSPALEIDVVDTVGAGDSFDAGFIYAFLNGKDLPTALQIANICGSLSTRAAGGTSAQATPDEVEYYLKTQPVDLSATD